MKKILATLVAVVFSTSAFAIDISNLSVGVTGNYGVYAANGKEENYTHTGTLEKTTKVTGKAFVDQYASIFVEASLNDNFSVGLSYVPEAIETPQNVNSGEGGDDTTDIKVEASFEDLMTLYALVKSDIGVYGKLGFSSMEIDVTSENAGTYADPGTNEGIELALGYEHEAADGMSVRAELAYHEFDDVSANNGITDKNEITITNMRGATGRISLVKSF